MVSFVGDGIDFFFNLLKATFSQLSEKPKMQLSKSDLFPGLPSCPRGRALSGVPGKAAPCCYALVSSRHRSRAKEMELKAQTSCRRASE